MLLASEDVICGLGMLWSTTCVPLYFTGFLVPVVAPFPFTFHHSLFIDQMFVKSLTVQVASFSKNKHLFTTQEIGQFVFILLFKWGIRQVSV